MDRYVRSILYVTVFVTGAAVLVVEVAAVRMLSPYYGSSLYVFSSVLTVILAALSVGYYLGGKLSDRYPAHEPLYVIIAASGISVLLMEFLAVTALPVANSIFSIISGPLIFGTLLFFVPAFLLGIVSPYIIKLQALHAPTNSTGNVAGTTFFFGTLGSIAGSLGTGFVLIPLLGIKSSILMTGLTLVVLGVCGDLLLSRVSATERISLFALIARRRTLILSILLISMLCVALIMNEERKWPYTVLYDEDALYSRLLVYEMDFANERVRFLQNDANFSSATSLDSFDLVFGYTQFAEFYRQLKPDTKRFLLLGGGAYSIPRTLVARDPDIQVDVVEIEPRLFSLAQEYFDLKDLSRIHNYPMDGRVFLREGDTPYDVIYGDAFNTDLGIPFHLTTTEFFGDVRRRLAPEGVFMFNYVGRLDSVSPNLTGSLYKTVQSVFPNVKVYAFDLKHPSERQNIMFVARNGDEPINLSGLAVNPNRGRPLATEDMEVWNGVFDIRNQLVFTDDRAPVELLLLKQL